LIEPEDQPVDMDADDDINNLAADEYVDELYNFYKLTEVPNTFLLLLFTYTILIRRSRFRPSKLL
jgi:hypothetical protein